MGARGPKPTPTVIKMLRGNTGRRPINGNEPTPDRLTAGHALAKCPKWLTGEARAIWNRITPGAIKAGLLTIVDLPDFEAYCQSYKRWREAERLTGGNLELAIAKGYRNLALKERAIMMQLGARFGFDPSSRSNVKIPQQKPSSRTDDFRRTKEASA